MSTNSADMAGISGRKLVAVLYADMVGYSRLIGLDDAGTLRRLKALRASQIDPFIAEYGGKIVQTGGDSLLVTFDSVDGAVRCATKIQEQIPVYDGDQPSDWAIRFRIGINTGDAIPDGTDLHGDAVNIAVRLQAECPPGAVYISRAVREQVRGRTDLAFEALGPLNLKNVARPIEAFVLRAESPTAHRSLEQALVHGAGDALPLPDKPSIAVLAFSNMSGDSEQEYFSDGIADDIITELSRSRSLFVIARNSSFTYKGRAVDIRKIARELGVRYVLEGSVRRSAGRVRVVAQLIEAMTSSHIWAERYDRSLEDVFAVQDEITTAVVTAIVPAVADTELQRVLRKPPESLGAWEAYQRGLWHLSRSNADDNAKAQIFLERAIASDAAFTSAHVALARVFAFQAVLSGAIGLSEGLQLARRHAREAVAQDPHDPDAQAIAAWLQAAMGQSESALETLAPVLERNPNSAWANGINGVILVSLGNRRDGRTALEAALRLNPRDPSAGLFTGWIAISYYNDRDYVRAVEAANFVIERYPDYSIIYRWLAAALGQLGRAGEAQEALQHALELSRRAFELHVHCRPAWYRPEDYDHMLEGLHKAGWQG
jgi:adenylate cyclase